MVEAWGHISAEALPSSPRFDDGSAARGLHADHVRALCADEAELLHFIERLPHAEQPDSAAGGIDDALRKFPAKLFGDFVAHGLFAFDAVGLFGGRDVEPFVFFPESESLSWATWRAQSEMSPSTRVTWAP